MSWDVYNAKTNLHDGSYGFLSDAQFYQMVLTVLWKGSSWEIKKRIDDPNDKRDISEIRARFHADHEDLLISSFGEKQYELLAKVQKANLSFTSVRWLDDILVFETALQNDSE